MFVAAKRIPVEQRKQIVEIVGTGSKEDKEYHRDIINENEVTERLNTIDNEDFRTFKKSFPQKQMFSRSSY